MKKGFTLVELLLGLCLLSLISIVVAPSINSSLELFNNHFKKLDMIYLGEMTIEKLKAFNPDVHKTTYIYDTKVEDIIYLFRLEERAKVVLKSEDEYKDYTITINKEEKDNKLWKVLVSVDYIRGRGKKVVEYKSYLPAK